MVFILYKRFIWKDCFKGGRLFLVDVKSPGGGELSLSACLGVGNRTSIEEKIANSWGYAPGGGGGGGNSKN